MVCKNEFQRRTSDGDIETVASYFRSEGNVEFSENNILNHIDGSVEKLSSLLSNSIIMDRTWLFEKFPGLSLI